MLFSCSCLLLRVVICLFWVVEFPYLGGLVCWFLWFVTVGCGGLFMFVVCFVLVVVFGVWCLNLFSFVISG